MKTTQNTDSNEAEHIQTDKQVQDDDSVKRCNGTQAQQNYAKIEVRKKVKGETLQSAFDSDASYGHKGTGYSAHIAEICNNCDKPEIITDYEVHGAHRSDAAKTTDVLNRLGKVDLVSETLFTDGGYPTVPSALQVVDTGVELVCPINRAPLVDNNTMSREHFRFSDDNRVICCPNGHAAIDHRILSNGTEPSLHAIFDGDICRQCAKLEQCPVRTPIHRARGCSPRNTVGNFQLEITRELRLRDAMFEQQKTRQWNDRYKIRSVIEATMSELKRLGMGKLRVRGLVKVIFAVSCKVIACNIKRWYKAVISAGPCQNPQNDPGNVANCIFCALDGFIFSILVSFGYVSCILSIANKPYMYGINSI